MSESTRNNKLHFPFPIPSLRHQAMWCTGLSILWASPALPCMAIQGLGSGARAVIISLIQVTPDSLRPFETRCTMDIIDMEHNKKNLYVNEDEIHNRS